MEEILNPPDPPTEEEQINFAIEIAFGALTATTKKRGIALAPVMGLMYLPTQQLTADFQVACRNIIESIKMPKVV